MISRHSPSRLLGLGALIAGLAAFLLGWSLFLSEVLRADPYFHRKALILATAGWLAAALLAWILGLSKRSRDHRIWFAALIFVVTVVVSASALLFGEKFSWDVSLLVWTLLSAGGALHLFWLLFLSGFTPKVRLGNIVVFCFIAGFLALFVRFERWDDFGKPVFAWRWTARTPAASALDGLGESKTFSPADLTTTNRDFPQFLGPDRNGILADIGLDWNWTTNPPKRLWRNSVGAGFGGFSVVNDYAVTLEQRGESECTVCYEARTGSEVWIHAEPARFESALGGIGPRSNATIIGGRVFVQGATGLLLCLDGATGELLWKVDIVSDNEAKVAEHGMAGSPLVVDDLVIVNAGGKQGHSLVAYKSTDGSRVWHSGNEEAGYASPMSAVLHGVSQVIYFHADGIAGHDLKSGRRLWNYSMSNGPRINCTQPIVINAEAGDLYFVNGYGAGESARVRVEPTSGDSWKVTEVWKSRALRSVFNNVVLKDGFVYGLDEGILTCLDLSDGERKWKKGRHGKGQLLLLGDRILVQEGEGGLALVATNTAKYEQLARMEGITGQTWNSPCLAGNLLLIRNREEAACFELKVNQP